MYSIIQIYDKGYKVRYISNNMEEIQKKYEILNINIKKYDNKNKIFIIDNNFNFITI